jgi:adenylate cyclase class IV
MEEEIKEEKLPPYTEFETKYRTELSVLPTFQRLAKAIPDLKEFAYACGPDEYNIRADSPIFLRFRMAEYPKSEPLFKQLTIKGRPAGAKNNIKRKEPNLNVSINSPEEIREFISEANFVFNFKIYKECHIYSFSDATIVFYTVKEEADSKEHYFIEIEVDEKTIHNLSEKEAWQVIAKYETILGETGINAQKRMRLSLFEMFRKDKK